MDWVTETIAIGNIEDAMDATRLREAGVTGVLCLNGFPQVLKFEDFAWIHAPLIDGRGNAPEDLATAIGHLRDLVLEHRVMVHCAEGVSRSPFVVACYLAEHLEIGLDEAITLVKEKRTIAIIDNGLMELAGECGWLTARMPG